VLFVRFVAGALIAIALAAPADGKPKRQKARGPALPLIVKPAPPRAPTQRIPTPMLTPEERDLVIRTVLGESNGQPYEGKVGVAAVIKNRMEKGAYGGTSARDVVLAPKQFEPWSARRRELLSYSPRTPGWSEAEAAVNDAFGRDLDPTGGATHFANVGTVEQRGNTRALGWIRGMQNVRKIGAHTFGNADGPGSGPADHVGPGPVPSRSSTSPRAILAGLGLEDDPAASFDFNSFFEETDDPRRLAIRELAFELLDDLLPPAGQGHAVAPDVGAVVEDEGELA
jgi:spore germination cell wall hydrolase CwlJ-like protein